MCNAGNRLLHDYYKSYITVIAIIIMSIVYLHHIRLNKRSVVDDVRKTIEHVRSQQPYTKAQYHHIDYSRFNGTEVEVHYSPSFMFNFIFNS